MKRKITALFALITVIASVCFVGCELKPVEAPVYSVTFVGGENAIGVAPSVSDKKEGETFVLPENTFEKEGYAFLSWNDGSSTFTVGATYTMPAKEVVFTAEWEAVPERYTVTYSLGEHAHSTAALPESVSGKLEGEKVVLPSAPTPAENYKFIGWSDGVSLYDAGDEYVVTANVTVTAVWEELPVVKEMIDDYKVVHGEFIGASESEVASSSVNALAIHSSDEFKYGTLEIDMNIPQSVTTGDHGIVFALTEGNTSTYWEGNGSSYYFFFIDANNNARLGKTGTSSTGSPTWSNCGEKPITGFVRGINHTLKVEYNGSRIKCYVDGELYINFVDNAGLTGTKYGFRSGLANNIVYSKVNCQSTDVAPDMGDIPDDQIPEDAMIRDYQIASGQYSYVEGDKMVSTSGNSLAVSKTGSFEKGVLEIDVLIPETLTTGDHGIVFGLTKASSETFWESGSSYYFFFIDANNNARLGRVGPTAADAWANCAEAPIVGFTRGITHTLKIEKDESFILCYVDGELLLTYGDSSPLNGVSYGMRAGGEGVIYSNVKIQESEGNLGETIQGFDTISGGFNAIGENIRSSSINSLALYQNELAQGTVSVLTSIPSAGWTGIAFGSDASASSYYRYLVKGDLSVTLEKVENGIATELKSTSLVAKYGSGAMVELKVIFTAEQIYTYIDDVCLVAWTAETSGNRVGIAASSANMIYKAFETSDNATPVQADVILWGHSHMQLWGNYESDLAGYGKVINMGIGGSNTPYWARLLDEICSYGASKMIVMTGSNDIPYTNASAIMEMEEDIFAELSNRIPSLKVYLITEFLQPCRLDYADRVHELNSLYFLYESKTDFVTVVDAYDIALNADGSLNYDVFIDIYHLTKAGYDVLAGRVRSALNGSYASSALDNYEIVEGEFTANGESFISAEENSVAIVKNIGYGRVYLELKKTASSDEYGGIVFAYGDEGYYYFATNKENAKLYKVVGTEKTLIKEISGEYALSQTISVKFADGEIICSIDGEEIISHVDESALNGVRFGVIGEIGGTIFEGLTAEKVAGKYNFTVGDESNWEITKNQEGNVVFKSLVKNSLLMFNDVIFTGGTVEFDMTVNAQPADHFFNVVNGIVFGATRLDLTHDLGNWYCFGRWPGDGQMVVFSKNNDLSSGQFLWENSNRYPANVQVGQKVHYKFVWDSKNHNVHIWADGVEKQVQPLARHFNGQYVGIYCDSANTVIENLTFTQKQEGGEGSSPEEPTVGVLSEAQKSELYNFTVGSSDKWEISKKEDGSYSYKSLEKNLMLMIKDKTFNGGAIEFDMTVNAEATDHTFQIVNGVVFGANGLTTHHDFGDWYCFGRWPGDGQIVGFSKDNSSGGGFLWENSGIYFANTLVGQKVHYKFVWDNVNNKVYIYGNGAIMAVSNLVRDFNGENVGIYCDSANTVIENLTFTALESTFMTAAEKAEKYNFTINGADNWVIEKDANGGLTYHGLVNSDSAMLIFKDITFTGGTVEFDMMIPTTLTTYKCLTGIVFGADSLNCNHGTSWYACGREQWNGFNTMSKENGAFAWEDSNKFVGVSVGVQYHYKFVWDAENGTVAYYLNGEYKNTQTLSRKLSGQYVGIYCETSGAQISNLTFTPAE